MGVSTDVSLGDYTRIDANVARNFKWDGVATTVKIYGRNLTNDQYATRYTTGYYYDRGRTLGAEVSFAF
ncbi:MAG: TonB-dependent receptor [Thiovulaceae bacterium]|nr:TonB-dependent receptor [Sulfurimonadaceae bacterium]